MCCCRCSPTQLELELATHTHTHTHTHHASSPPHLTPRMLTHYKKLQTAQQTNTQKINKKINNNPRSVVLCAAGAWSFSTTSSLQARRYARPSTSSPKLARCVCACVHVHVYMCVRVHVRMCMCVHVWCVYVYCMCTCVPVRICVCVHALCARAVRSGVDAWLLRMPG